MTRPSDLSRREVLAGGLALAASGALLAPPSLAATKTAAKPLLEGGPTPAPAAAALRSLESRHHARLGVYAVNHRTGGAIDYRADERFAFCSTFKAWLVARVLRDFDHDGSFLNRLVRYDKSDLIEGSLVTSSYVETGMTVRTLCAAALAQSDNTAANLLFEATGGPAGLTRFLRSLGDEVSRSDRDEPSLNSAIPGDPRDTTSPRAFGQDLTKLLLGDVLSDADRAQLRFWMEGDCVNTGRFRAGLPKDWLIADKTGSGYYGVTNDVGVVWTSRRTPLTIAVLTGGAKKNAPYDEGLVAGAARIVAEHLAPRE